MGETTWTARSTSTTVTITLNSVSDDGVAQSTAEIDNSANKDLFAALMLNLASLDLSSQANPAVYVWFLDNIDSTQESYNTAPARAPDAIIVFETGSGAMTQNPIVRDIRIPPISFDIVVQNKMGVSFPSSGNTLEIETYGVTTA